MFGKKSSGAMETRLGIMNPTSSLACIRVTIASMYSLLLQGAYIGFRIHVDIMHSEHWNHPTQGKRVDFFSMSSHCVAYNFGVLNWASHYPIQPNLNWGINN